MRTIPTIETLEIEIKKSSNTASNELEALAGKLTSLKNVSGQSANSLNKVSSALSELNKSLGKINTGDFEAKLKRIGNGLESLKADVDGLKISSSVSNQLEQISAATDNIKWTDGDKIEALANGLKPLGELGRANMTSFINQLGKLPAVITELEAADIDKFTQQMQDLAAAMKPFSDEMQQVSNGFAALPSRIQRLITSTEQYNGTVSRATSRTNKFTSALKKLGIAFTLKKAISLLWGAIETSSEYTEIMNMFSVSMGEYGEEAYEYATKVSEVMGIDPAEWAENQGVFNSIIKGFGVAGDKAAVMSKNLTQLGYDLASFYDISFESAMQKVQSGISGELEPLRRLGYDLSVARLQQEALNLGIEKSVSEMTQAEKAQLRYYAMLTQVTTAQGDMARTLDQPANQLRILSAQVTQLSRAIGDLFIPALNKILPVVTAIVKATREIVQEFALLFGIKLSDGVDWSKGENATDSIAEDMESAENSAKEMKKFLMGIDELNIMPDQSSSSDESSGSSFDIPVLDYSEIFLQGVESWSDELAEKVRVAIDNITAIASGASLAVGTILAVSGVDIPRGIALMAAGAVGLAATATLNWDEMDSKLEKTLSTVTGTVSGFLLGLGAIFAFSGVNIPLGIALMLGGAASLAAGVAIDWNSNGIDVENALTSIEGIVSGALLGVGALLALTGADVPLGIGLLVAGAAGLATNVALNWKAMDSETSAAISRIAAIVGTGMLAIGAILTFTGVNAPLGIALMAAGAAGLVGAVALNWDWVVSAVKTVFAGLLGILSGGMIVLGTLLLLSGAGMGLGLAVLAAGLGTSYVAWKIDDNPVTRFVKKMANSVIGIVNTVIDAINSMFHISFDGLSLFGKEVIPAFDVRLVNLKHIRAFEFGGFPEVGEIFIAREHGTEMVGSIGNRPAVANNGQIVQGISYGVRDANTEVVNAIYAVAVQIIRAIEEQDDGVYLDGERVTARVTQTQNQRNRMYGR